MVVSSAAQDTVCASSKGSKEQLHEFYMTSGPVQYHTRVLVRLLRCAAAKSHCPYDFHCTLRPHVTTCNTIAGLYRKSVSSWLGIAKNGFKGDMTWTEEKRRS